LRNEWGVPTQKMDALVQKSEKNGKVPYKKSEGDGDEERSLSSSQQKGGERSGKKNKNKKSSEEDPTLSSRGPASRGVRGRGEALKEKNKESQGDYYDSLRKKARAAAGKRRFGSRHGGKGGLKKTLSVGTRERTHFIGKATPTQGIGRHLNAKGCVEKKGRTEKPQKRKNRFSQNPERAQN